MKAEDTVMGNKKLQLLGQQYEDDVPTCDFTHYALEAQAEISFKAGQKQVRDFEFNPDYLDFQRGVAEGRKLGRQAGIKEVVEWILAHSQLERCDPDVMAYFTDYLAVDYPDWQAKLKEWGIE